MVLSVPNATVTPAAGIEGNGVARNSRSPTDCVIWTSNVHARARIGSGEAIITGFAAAVGECAATVRVQADEVANDGVPCHVGIAEQNAKVTVARNQVAGNRVAARGLAKRPDEDAALERCPELPCPRDSCQCSCQ